MDVEAGPVRFAVKPAPEATSPASSTPGFVRFQTPSSHGTPDSGSDYLSELEAEVKSDQRWLDRRGKDHLTYDEIYDRSRIVRNRIGEVTGHIRPPTHLLKTLRDRGAELKKDGVIGAGWFNYRGNQKRARDRVLIGTPTAAELSPQTTLVNTPDKGYAADVGSECPTPVNLVYKGGGMPKYFTTIMQEPQRFCMFNTGYMRKAEFWDFLRVRLIPETLQGVQRVQVIRQPNRNTRVDFWVDASCARGLKQALYLGSKQRRLGVRKDLRMPLYDLSSYWKPNKEISRWRLDVFRPWKDRALTYMPPKTVRVLPMNDGFATFNVNGLIGKQSELVNFLYVQRMGFVAVQETLMSRDHYRLQMAGYEVFTKPKVKGFRGQALLIDKRYPAYAVGAAEDNSLIHVKVAGLPGEGLWHLMSVYLPSGGNCRSERTAALKKVLAEYKKLVDKDPAAAIVIMGDFNMPRGELSKRIKTNKTGLECLTVKGSGLTFHRKGSRWTDVDSILVSPNAKSHLTSAKVLRNWSISSDHYPLSTKLRVTPPPLVKPNRVPKYRFNLDAVKGHGAQLVNSNRWKLLPVDEIEEVESLDDGAHDFDHTTNMVALDLGIKQQVIGKTYVINRQLKRRVNRLSKLKRSADEAARNREDYADDLLIQYKRNQRAARKCIAQREKALHQKEIKRISKLCAEGEMRAFHRWEETTTTGGRASASVKPIQDKNGKLLTDPAAVRERVYTYYKELNQDDPEKLSNNKEHWKGKFKERRKEPLDGVNDPFTWTLVLLAIRHMALGTAPGHNDIPVEVFKALLKEECHVALEKLNSTRVGDNIYVALPEDLLPEEPVTNMGKALWRIVQGIWKVRRQPDTWAKVVNKSLYKAGDPTDPKNYRGISLICVAMKIVTVMMADRISTVLERNNILITEQGGFRSHEEAIAQFIALAEIVRRRRIKEQKTYIVFIDFYKAFDKVMHEALFEKLDAMGFRGQFLDLLMAIYKTSKACLRVGDDNSPFYDMLRGTRQGCPLSPILFLIFINDFLTYIPEGVEVPGMADGRKCPGLLFADDVAGLTGDIDNVHKLLDGVTNWSTDWKMPMGAPKCGVMLAAGTEAEQAELFATEFVVDGQKVNATRSYKYLGVIITDKLGDAEQSDEWNHSKTLAKRVEQAINIRRGFLRDPKYPLWVKLEVINSKIIPLGIYGGEWIAFNQKRTNLIQRKVNVALKLILQSSSRSNLHAVKVMLWELGVTSVEERTSDLRLRLWQKVPELKTWISLLVKKENRFISKNNVWSKFTPVAIDRVEKQDLDIKSGWIWDTLLQEGKVRPFPAESDNPAVKNAKQRQDMRLRLITRSFKRDLHPATPVKATRLYARDAFYGCSRRYLKSAINLPGLSEGTIWLVRVRTSAWWDTNKRWDYLTKVSRDHNHIERGRCPCCLESFDEQELAHLLLECPCFNSQRKRWLEKPIELLWNELDEERGTLKSEFSRQELVYRLLGGYLDDGTRQGSNLNVEKETSVLSLWAWGWGSNEEYKCPGFSVHGYVPVAKYLAAVMPKHKALLFPDGKRKRDSLAYDTTSGEDSPIKVPRSWTPSSGSEGDGMLPVYTERLDGPEPTNNQAEASRSMARRIGKHAVLQITSSEGSNSERDASDNPGYESSPMIGRARGKLGGAF